MEWLLGTLAVAALLACVPSTLRFDVTTTPTWQGHVELRWGGMFGVRTELP